MTSNRFNMTTESAAQQKNTQMDLRAALLIHNLRRGKTNRSAIELELNKMPDADRERMRSRLNYYKNL